MQAFVLLILYGMYVEVRSVHDRHRIVPCVRVRCHAIKEEKPAVCASCADMAFVLLAGQRSCLHQLNRRSIQRR